MRIINLSQTADREAWLLEKRGRITGSISKKVKPLTKGIDRTPQGFWDLLAGKIAIAPDGEKPLDRGNRLENEALDRLAKEYGLDIDTDPGMWVSDIDEDIAVSPDGAEKSSLPTWAAEAKCLSSANHLKFVVRARQADATVRPIDLVPNDGKNAYKEQVVQYFVVNESLQRLYFVFYDDRIDGRLPGLDFHVLIIEREDIANEIQAQKYEQINTLNTVNKLIAELAKE